MKALSFDLKKAKALLPKRKKFDNKTAGGKVLIIAGSGGMFGAAVLSATAASRVGAGYVTLMTDQRKFPSHKNPDFLIVDWQNKKIDYKKFSSVAIGPGLGKSAHVLSLLKTLSRLKIENVVVDADALNACAKNNWFEFCSTWIATPHEGELARILGIAATKIKNNREQSVIKAQEKLGCIVVLKGAGTLVADGTKLYKIKSGNSALAKAGTGDVLTGMVAGFLSQKIPAAEAACLSCFVHGWMADRWIKNKKDHLSLMASDLLAELPRAIYKIRS